MGDQRELFGPVASVPTAWRALKEAASGGDRACRKVTVAVNLARRHAWAQAGPLPPVRIADRQLEGVTCIRLDATVVPAHSDKELTEANFKGYGHHPLLAACDNTGEPLAWMLRPGSAGSNTAADHLRLLREAIEALPPALRRRIMVTCDGAGASHELVKELDRLASRHQDGPGLDGEGGGAVDGLAAQGGDHVGEDAPYPGCGVADVDDGVAGRVEVGGGAADRDGLAGADLAGDHGDGLVGDGPGNAGGGLAAVVVAVQPRRRQVAAERHAGEPEPGPGRHHAPIATRVPLVAPMISAPSAVSAG
jgi:hypothetical protein